MFGMAVKYIIFISKTYGYKVSNSDMWPTLS